MIKRLLFMSFMLGAIGMPYLVTNGGQLWSNLTSRVTSSPPADKPAAPSVDLPGVPAANTSDRTPPGPFYLTGKSQPLEGTKPQDLAEVLQFQATPTWVMARWPRVTAGLAELDLQGYRVPLVSGTNPDDLAGSLTYYFDKNQQVARIIFHGTTGDPRKLVGLVSTKYQLLPQATDDPALMLYQAKWNGKPHSELRIRTARVLRADQPFARYEVDLAIKRP